MNRPPHRGLCAPSPGVLWGSATDCRGEGASPNPPPTEEMNSCGGAGGRERGWRCRGISAPGKAPGQPGAEDVGGEDDRVEVP